VLNILSKNQVKQSYLPSMSNALSEISKADSLIKKVAKVVKFIILMPALVVYDSLYLLSRPFKKNVKKVSLMDRVFPAGFEKNKALVAKISLTAVGVIGSYLFIKKWFSKPLDQGNLYLYGGLVGAVLVVGGLIQQIRKNAAKNAAIKELQSSPEFQRIKKTIADIGEVYRKNKNLPLKKQLSELQKIKEVAEEVLKIEHPYYFNNYKRDMLTREIQSLNVWTRTIKGTIHRLESESIRAGVQVS